MNEKEELIKDLENMRDTLLKPVNYVELALIDAEFKLGCLRYEYIDLLQKFSFAERFISSQGLTEKYKDYITLELL